MAVGEATARRKVPRNAVAKTGAQPVHGSAAMNSQRERNLKMLAALLIVLFPLTLAWLAWMAVFVANDPGEEIRHVKHHRFLGPGGPDDPFADDPFDD
jgi:hypothetical protein